MSCLNLLFLLGALLLAVPKLSAQSETNLTYLLRAQQAFLAARTNCTLHPEDTNVSIRFASACFDLTDFATNDTQRADLAQQGVDVCLQVLARDSNSAPAHYYLAMNLGELAQAKAPSLAAYRLVHQVEHEFQTAAALDAAYDHAGPPRNLGELYFQAPGWPISIGSNRKAREWLERAVKLDPAYPENQIDLLEARLHWRQQAEAEATLHALTNLWAQARVQLAGPAREKDWEDWTARRVQLEAEYRRIYPPAGKE